MNTTADTSRECNLSLTADERTQLLRLLEQELPAKRVEVHRTEAPDFREFVEHEAEVLQSVIEKLRRG